MTWLSNYTMSEQFGIFAALSNFYDQLSLASRLTILRSKEIEAKIKFAEWFYLSELSKKQIDGRLRELEAPPQPDRQYPESILEVVVELAEVEIPFTNNANATKPLAKILTIINYFEQSLGYSDYMSALPLQTVINSWTNLHHTSNLTQQDFTQSDFSIRDGFLPAHLSSKQSSFVDLLPELPARPDDLKIVEFAGQKQATDRSTPESLHKQIFGIELQAAELCAWAATSFQGLPRELTYQLARQCWDEARHARMLLNEYNRFGEPITKYDIDFRIWSYGVKAETISEYLMIENIIGEGFGLGNDLILSDYYREISEDSLSRIHMSIHYDEVAHTKIGTSWVKEMRELFGGRTLEEMEKLIPRPTYKEPHFYREIKEFAGFTSADLQRQSAKAVKKES